MVFCEASMLLNVASTIMMNGVCCIHSMEEDERRMKEQKEVLKKHIKVEWQRQLILEKELQEQILREQGLDAATLLAAERRRQLMATKLRASQYSSRKSDDTNAAQAHGTNYQYVGRGRDVPHSPTEGTQQGGGTYRKVHEETHHHKKQDLGVGRIRSAPVLGAKGSTRVPLVVDQVRLSEVNTSGYSSAVSSLLDEDSDDDEEDFEVINLQ
jgi:hypothetical protein